MRDGRGRGCFLVNAEAITKCSIFHFLDGAFSTFPSFDFWGYFFVTAVPTDTSGGSNLRANIDHRYYTRELLQMGNTTIAWACLTIEKRSEFESTVLPHGRELSPTGKNPQMQHIRILCYLKLKPLVPRQRRRRNSTVLQLDLCWLSV